MPDVDGLAAGKAIRTALGEEVAPIIAMVTAYAREELAGHRDAGVADVILGKPVTASALFNAVAEAKRRRAEARPQGPTIQPPVYTAAGREARLAGLRVMVVDDSELNLEVARMFLELDGAEVVLARDGQEALENLRVDHELVDVVLMDVQMPGIDGYETTRQIRRGLKLAHLPVVAVTAGVFQEQRQAAEEAGMTGFLAKPFEHDALVAVVREVLGTKG